MLSSHVLVLNRTFMPVHITNLKHALCLLYKGIAKAVDEEYKLFDFKSWTELSIAVHQEKLGLINRAIRVPRVILLQYYDHLPRRPVRFSRINVYLRDCHTCQYCGRHLPRSELNLDHITPISLGGKTSWDNVVCSCVPCNIKKGSRPLERAGMRLLKHPTKPHWSIFFRLSSKPNHYDEWKPYLSMVDFSYWNSELKEE